ncbi:MAG: hypothetical protein V7K20_17455 [Nostoc sp.]
MSVIESSSLSASHPSNSAPYQAVQKVISGDRNTSKSRVYVGCIMALA